MCVCVRVCVCVCVCVCACCDIISGFIGCLESRGVLECVANVQRPFKA